ncbi:MAG: DUF4097 family beta strand repeat-containing protein [Eubacteriales bacterium]|nr:DUF4097 family beta strand repeat-containing protein [Eubacteriales bacterium]
MNRIETKIIIMVTNRLASAKDSDAKTEMIEELSENLYQRYLEQTAAGNTEEEALQQAFESLGDVEELLAYLKETEQEEIPAAQAAPGEESQIPHEEETFQDENKSSAFRDDLENGIEEIVNAALSTAKVAVDCAKDVARDVSGQIKERYPNGVWTQFTTQRGKKVDCTAVMPENVHSLEIHLTNGDVRLCCAEEPDAFIEVTGDTEAIETMLKDDGILSITQGNTASSAFLFMRGVWHSDLVVRLPKKVWNRLDISTVNGDIEIEDTLECQELNVFTSSGDLDMDRVSCEHMTFRSSSGDICGQELCGDLYAETKSGDIDMRGSAGQCELYTASGDVSFSGKSRELNCSSTSGDIDLSLEVLPEKTRANSVSGDCEVQVSTEQGFRVSYRTVSGDFWTNLPLAGSMEKKKGEAVFGDGASGVIQISSVSGDISLKR